MDDLINPPKELDAQERVMQTMELQTDTQLQVENFAEKMKYWDETLAPSDAQENTDDTQASNGMIKLTTGRFDHLAQRNCTELKKWIVTITA